MNVSTQALRNLFGAGRVLLIELLYIPNRKLSTIYLRVQPHV